MKFEVRMCVSANGPAGLEPGKSVPPLPRSTGVGMGSIYEQHKTNTFINIYIFNINNLLEIM